MKIKEVSYGENRNLIIIDDIYNLDQIYRIYHTCCQQDYRMSNGSRFEIQSISDRRLVCRMGHNHPLIEYFFHEKSPCKDIFLKYIDNTKYFYQRSYINLGTISDSNQIHTDSECRYSQRLSTSKTVLYYANTEWKHEYGGQTIFYDPNDISNSYIIDFIPGRLVIFDGEIPHNVLPRSLASPSYRFTVALKWDLISSKSKKEQDSIIPIQPIQTIQNPIGDKLDNNIIGTKG